MHVAGTDPQLGFTRLNHELLRHVSLSVSLSFFPPVDTNGELGRALRPLSTRGRQSRAARERSESRRPSVYPQTDVDSRRELG